MSKSVESVYPCNCPCPVGTALGSRAAVRTGCNRINIRLINICICKRLFLLIVLGVFKGKRPLDITAVNILRKRRRRTACYSYCGVGSEACCLVKRNAAAADCFEAFIHKTVGKRSVYRLRILKVNFTLRIVRRFCGTVSIVVYIPLKWGRCSDFV